VAPLRIAVLAKQIPDPEETVLDEQRMTIVRDGKLILDDSDSYGVEVGLRLAEASGEGEVALVSMAPHEETNGLRTGLAMGAARAVLVSDEALAGSDALSTAKVLAAALRRVEPDLVIAATESTDGYTGTVPVQVAELLGWPAVTFARHVELDGERLLVHRQTEGGYDEVACALPCVVSVTAGVVEPRYPSFKGIMSARSKPVDVVSLADLGIEPETVGARGSRQEVVSVVEAPARAAGEVVTDTGDAEARIVAYLQQLKLV